MKAENHYDVVVLGGGLAGLTLATQLVLRMPGIRLAVIERRSHPVPEAAFKIGESSVEIGAHYFAEDLGLKDHIAQDQLPKLGLRYFFAAGDNARIEDRVEMGGNKFFPAPSYQFDRGRFENFLGEHVGSLGIDFLDGTKVTAVALSENGGAHRVETKQDAYTADWVVDASGRSSFLKTQLDLAADVEHEAHSSWFRFDARIKIDDWTEDAAWQARNHEKPGARWLSTNHLMGEGYWVWLIPLASGSTSVGIVVDGRLHPFDTIDTFKKCMAWLQKHEPQCAERIAPHADDLQDFAGFQKFSYSAQQVYSEHRWALTGEAGVFLDPFYSPGSDFIAISNTFVTDLIERDRRGSPFEVYASLYNDIYFKLFEGNLSLYLDQYPLFGNPAVMPAKVVWDFAYYWSFPAFFFFHDRLCDLRAFASAEEALDALRDLNAEVQAVFREWHAATPDARVEGGEGLFFDVTEIPMMYRLNRGLTEPLADDAFVSRLMENIDGLRALADKIKNLRGTANPADVHATLAVLS